MPPPPFHFDLYASSLCQIPISRLEKLLLILKTSYLIFSGLQGRPLTLNRFLALSPTQPVHRNGLIAEATKVLLGALLEVMGGVVKAHVRHYFFPFPPTPHIFVQGCALTDIMSLIATILDDNGNAISTGKLTPLHNKEGTIKFEGEFLPGCGKFRPFSTSILSIFPPKYFNSSFRFRRHAWASRQGCELLLAQKHPEHQQHVRRPGQQWEEPQQGPERPIPPPRHYRTAWC